MDYDQLGSFIDQIVLTVQQQKQKPATAGQEQEANTMPTSTEGKVKKQTSSCFIYHFTVSLIAKH